MTVFEVMSRLAIEHGSINLGQGFPDEEGPETIVAKLDEASRTAPNQYPPMMGVPELRQAVAAHAKRFYDLGVDWQTEVMVTSGATEALAASILSLLNPGDEAVVFEPLYDSYVPMLRRAGAEVKLVPLKPPDWAVPQEALESVRRLYVGLQSFRSMSRMDASLMKASALRLRFSQSLASRRQRLSQAMVRSTTQRLGWTTKPFTRSDRLTISVSRSGRMPARAR